MTFRDIESILKQYRNCYIDTKLIKRYGVAEMEL